MNRGMFTTSAQTLCYEICFFLAWCLLLDNARKTLQTALFNQRRSPSNLRADRLIAVVPRPARSARAHSWQGADAVVLARDGALGHRAVVARPSLL